MATSDPIADGEVELSVDEAEGVLRLKAVATFDDPVELTADGARELAQRLLELADQVG